MFRCCLPCRGGSGSAAPATSPQYTLTHHTPTFKNKIKRKYSGKSLDGEDALISVATSDDAPKKSPLNETTTSFQTLTTAECEGFSYLSSTIDATCLPRKAEPETFSDTSVSPTTTTLQAITGSSSSGSLHPDTTSTLVTTAFTITLGNTVVASSFSPTSPQSYTPVDCTVTHYISTTASSLSSLEKSVHTGSTVISSSVTTRSSCQPQTSPLPNIKEEEETDHFLARQLKSLNPYLKGNCENRIGNNLTSSAVTVDSGIIQQDNSTSTPSPRIKLKLRKHYKSAWSRTTFAPNVTAVFPNFSEVNAVNATASKNNTNSKNKAIISGGSFTAIQASSPHLNPIGKMQAEQGSIGDLQKYHSRYLKNRRHTLANVR